LSSNALILSERPIATGIQRIAVNKTEGLKIIENLFAFWAGAAPLGKGYTNKPPTEPFFLRPVPVRYELEVPHGGMREEVSLRSGA
jgi:hypothetical protein